MRRLVILIAVMAASPYWHPTDIIGRIKQALKKLAKPRRKK